MGKAESNKQLKRESLLNTAYKLFTTKGIHDTSISDIVKEAGVAKGTFYLYFKDKYDINNKLVYHRSTKLFENAVDKLMASDKANAPVKDKLIFIIDCVIDALADNKSLLMFISKNLGLGFYRYAMETAHNEDDSIIRKIDEEVLNEIDSSVTNPELMMYMIIELTGSSIFSSILYEKPVSIEELKPHLYTTILNIVDQFTIK
ncbi:MAG: TetR/AcrR family transcriptional regulator [Lachnospiraceae bacterium]|nr:TetR/AcrR family transcriptional regulator [Lachnospiraceae bacterium]